MSAPAIPRVSFDVDEAAQSAGVTAKAIREAIRRGDLKAKRQSRRTDNGEGIGKLLIPFAELQDWIERLPDA